MAKESFINPLQGFIALPGIFSTSISPLRGKLLTKQPINLINKRVCEIILDTVKYNYYFNIMKNEEIIINKIRKFNRFYTNLIGLLEKGYLNSPFTLTEVRVLFEIYHTENCTAKDIRTKIDIDEGYLSRIIDSFVKQKYLNKKRSRVDGRAKFLLLTEKGKSEYLKLDTHSQNAVSGMISSLSVDERNNLIEMMNNIEKLLSKV